MKAVLWNYRFENMKETWYRQVLWLVNSLNKQGIDVKKHKGFICRNTENLKLYNHNIDNPCDIVIYNHADMSHLTGNIVNSKVNWFLKPTVPEQGYTTLDTLGYGPYSSITYHRPPYRQETIFDVDKFYNTKVKKWKEDKSTKWGKYFENKETTVDYKDYILVLGQCGGDEVVTRHDFGVYFSKLESVVKELARITNELIIVKLHPYTDGKDATDFRFSKEIAKRLIKYGKNIKVYLGKSNVHNFIENAKCVFLANSGAGFEVMMHDKPIIAWGYPEYHWVAYDLRHLCDIKRALSLEWFNKEHQRKFLYWYLEKYCYYDQNSCDRRVKELYEHIR